MGHVHDLCYHLLFPPCADIYIYIYIYGWPVDLDMVLFAADVESAMLKALDKICASIALFNIHHHIAETALLCPLSGKCQLLQYW